jgi:hypothetical protein
VQALKMSRLKFGAAECEVNKFHRARFDSRRSFTFRIANFVALSASFLVCYDPKTSRAQQRDFSIYAHAVEFCRGNVTRPMALDLDKRVLCFDGQLQSGEDVSIANDLEADGLFVVRGSGGDIASAIRLSDLLQSRRATVVVYDYCLSTCASYLLFASAETFVMKETVVAWSYSDQPPWCPSLVVPKDAGPKRLEVAPCSDAPAEYQSGYREFQNLSRAFYAARTVDPLTEWPPESFPVRRILKSMFERTGRFPYVVWTWNPRYYAASIKTKVVYEEYPKGQSEADAIGKRIRLPYRLIYDP